MVFHLTPKCTPFGRQMQRDWESNALQLGLFWKAIVRRWKSIDYETQKRDVKTFRFPRLEGEVPSRVELLYAVLQTAT